MTRALAVGVFSLALATSVLMSSANAENYVQFNDEHLDYGRTLWLETCEACHGYGIAGAPIPMKPREWRERVIKPEAELYDHAINGFFGPGDTMMPARGGNDALSDDEVRAAVDYMVALAKFYIEQERN